MSDGTDTLGAMDGSPGDAVQQRFDALHAEAAAALSYGANTLRAIRDRYREAYLETLGRVQGLRDDLVELERRTDTVPSGVAGSGDGAEVATVGDGRPADAPRPARAVGPGERDAAVAADARDAATLRLRRLRTEVEGGAVDLGRSRAELSRLELAVRNLESTWLFLERGDTSLLTDDASPTLPTEVQMRIVEAQEAERARLAQEVHDGPAQALSNAIFQVEYIDRVLESDARLARTELRFLRELLRRELGDVRSFITQLRPPVLVELGLDGSIADAAEMLSALSGLRISTDLEAPAERLTEAEQTVVLRIVQEALQNVRKHASATSVAVVTRLADDAWSLEVRDDGRGFDVGAVAARGRRNFGLQFMRERAELIGARVEIQSRPDAGTVVTLRIPLTGKERR
jgi:two-component system sensor histidine kinase DegS